MSKAESPHPEFDSSGPIVGVELRGNGPPVFVDHLFQHLDFDLDNDPATPSFEIVSAFDWPQVEARYIVTQPASLKDDPRRGWAPIGGVYSDRFMIDPSQQSHFTFSEATDREPQLLVCAYETFLSLTACSNALVKVHLPVESILNSAEASARKSHIDSDMRE